MNAEQFRKNVGSLVRLRPIARRRLPTGQSLDPIDYEWRVLRIVDGSVELTNIRTDHITRLGFDNIREFRTPNFLLLRCQLILCGNQVLIEPFIGR